jgi:citrate lyase subunit beta/citryl-CoA lyase
VSVPPLTWLFVPADRPDRVEKAIASRAHAVIVDLEDGVAPASKQQARENLVALLAERCGKPVLVRVNAGEAADLDVLGSLAVDGVLAPKVSGPGDVPSVGLPVHCLIESALGVERAFEIASTPGVDGISLGEADLRSQTGVLEAGLDWARARIVNAAVAAGLPRPPQSVYPNVADTEGLARSCARGKELGHLGRTAIHPSQLEIIEQAYLPTRDELARALETMTRLETTLGATTLAAGEMVDAAMLGAARQVVALAERYGTSGT